MCFADTVRAKLGLFQSSSILLRFEFAASEFQYFLLASNSKIYLHSKQVRSVVLEV